MATGAPGTNGVWQYGEDDSEATFSALLNKVASTADTAIGTDRGRLTTLEARKLSGLVPIIPTGVNYTSGSASYNSTTGLITFSGVTGLTPLGVFTSAYRNYTLIGNIDSTSGTGGDLGVRLNNNGTDSTTLNYYTSGNWSNSNAANNLYYNVGATLGYFGNLFSTADAYTNFMMDIYNPQVTKLTSIRTLLNGLSAAGASANYQSTVLHNLNNSYNGLTMWGVSGTAMSGTVKVYGWN